MQDRLNSNASKNNVDSSSLDTLKTILSNLIKCRGPLIKMAVKLDKTMEIAGDGEPVLIAVAAITAVVAAQRW